MSDPYYEAGGVTLYLGDCVEVMRSLPDACVDAIVTDPPYELGFMGKGWDATGIANSVEMWAEAIRVLKPGGHLAAFGGTRTYHRMACAIEDAGFEVRDCLAYMYGSGFPKSLNVSRDDRFCHCEPATERDVRYLPDAHVSPSIDAQEQRREVLLAGLSEQGAPPAGWPEPTAPLRGREPSVEGRGDLLQDEGELHGSPLRASAGVGAANGKGGRIRDGASVGDSGLVRVPADEDGGREPQGSRSVEQRALESGTLADERRSQARGVWPLCERCGKPNPPDGLGTALKPAYEPIVLARKPLIGTVAQNVLTHGTGVLNIDGCRIESDDAIPVFETTAGRKFQQHDEGEYGVRAVGTRTNGRWPANVLLDEEAAATLDAQTGDTGAAGRASGPSLEEPYDGSLAYGARRGTTDPAPFYGDRGGASRFFYTSKASRSEREAGVEVEAARRADANSRAEDAPGSNNPRLRVNARRNDHPTVKPVDLMRWLCRLVTPPGGVVLDCFNGSGTTGMAALDEGFRYIGIEREERYIEIAKHRITHRHLLEVETKPATAERQQGALL